MNPDTLIVVHCYAGDRQRVEDFLPVYLRHECPVLLLSPKDAPVRIDHPQVVCRSAGLAGWDGPHTIYRQIEHWRIASEFPERYFLLHDSDSVSLAPELPAYLYRGGAPTLWCNAVGKPSGGAGRHGMNLLPPYFLERNTLRWMVAAADVPTEERKAAHDGGNVLAYPFPWGDCLRIDGLYVAMADHLGLTVEAFPDGCHAFARGSLLLDRRAAQGATFLHPVKTKNHLAAIELAYNRMRYRLALR